MIGLGRQVGRALVAVSAVVLVLGMGASPAVGEDTKPDTPDTSDPTGPVPGGFSSWRELIDVQDRLTAAGERLDAEGANLRGFTGIEVVPERRQLNLYWQGQVPTSMVALVRELGREVAIDTVPARHDLAELLGQQGRIAVAPGVTAVSPNVDGSGLTVSFDGSEAAALRVPAIQAATVPITILAFDRWQALGCTGRQDDCSPYWGGAKWTNPAGGSCSTGFGVLHNGVKKMLSAAHCAANGQVAKDGGGEVMGTIQGDNNGRDTLLINHAPATADGRMYTGPWTSGLAQHKKVAGKTASLVGQFVGTSGARTGEHCCNIKITAVNALVNTNVGPMSPMVLAAHQTGGAAGAPGDSGGPVFSPAPAGKVTAKGTISAGGGVAVLCWAAPAPGAFIDCFPKLAYADVSKTIQWYDANPAATTISLLTVP